MKPAETMTQRAARHLGFWDAMENREPMTLEALSVHTLIACMMDRAGNAQEVRAAMFPALYEIYLQEYQETAEIIRGLKGSE